MLEEIKTTLIYVNCNDESKLQKNKKTVSESIAESVGISTAESMFNEWIINYDSFLYDTGKHKLLFYKPRVSGDWKADTNNLNDYIVK